MGPRGDDSGQVRLGRLSIAADRSLGRTVVMGALRVGGPAGVDHSDESFCVWVCHLAIKARNGALSESARTSVRLYNVRGLD